MAGQRGHRRCPGQAVVRLLASQDSRRQATSQGNHREGLALVSHLSACLVTYPPEGRM